MDINQITITLPLKKFLHHCLGRGYWSNRYIDEDVADLVLQITRNRPECGYHIADTDPATGFELPEPMLFVYSAWAESNERHEKAQKRSQYEREQRFIFEANLKLIVKGVNRVLCVEGDAANVIAHQFLAGKQYNKIRAVGVQKLYTSIEEI